MARLTGRALALLGCSMIFALMTACRSGSDPEPTVSTAPAAAATPSATVAPSDSLLPEGTYRTPKLTRQQLLTRAKKAGLTQAQAEQALRGDRITQSATFTLQIEGGMWTQSYAYDGTREGIGFAATYKVQDPSTVVVTEVHGDVIVFAYALDGDAIRISFKYAEPQFCPDDPKCWMGFIVWESAPFSRV